MGTRFFWYLIEIMFTPPRSEKVKNYTEEVMQNTLAILQEKICFSLHPESFSSLRR